MTVNGIHIGGPIWSHKGWKGSFFRTDAKAADFLGQYASVFNAVEGNSTFYALPSRHTVDRWLIETPAHFRFSFKVPRTISHGPALHASAKEMEGFLRWLQPLKSRLGPTFLQLPNSFGPSRLTELEHFLDCLPPDYPWAVEVRHPDLITGPNADQLQHMLQQRHIDLVCFDTSVLHAITDPDVSIRAAQQRKPRTIPRLAATGQRPFIRFCGHNDLEPNQSRLTVLAKCVADWCHDGKTPHIFIHSPDEQQVPQLCRYFIDLLMTLVPDIGHLPPFPVEGEPRQETLF